MEISLTGNFKSVRIADIIVPEDRQRKSFKDIDDLADSIKRLGLIHPLVLRKDMTLVAGERRLRAMKSLGWDLCPVQFAEDLDPRLFHAIELEENVKRSNLDWQEEAAAVKKIHDLYTEVNPGWTLQKTAEMVGLSSGHTSAIVSVAKAIEKGDARIKSAPTLSAANNIISKRADREFSNALNEVLELTSTTPKQEAPTQSVLNVDALEWMYSYEGPKFNFLHCDFPYGINFNKGEQIHSGWADYADSPDVYWALLGALADNYTKLLHPSSHIMFWYSMNWHEQTMEFFRTKLPLIDLNPFPLIWHKSDNKGLLPDPKRGPRRIYETALFGSMGDRQIIKATSNLYACPANKKDAEHVSEKPQSMLEYFFEMFVDDTTKLLDPTCGAGSALRAAENKKANFVLGLERNKEFADNAQTLIHQQRILAQASKTIGG